jgi:small subunit ribosomal protein S3
VKVWIYKGEILPYKSAVEDKIAREAAMAVGETAGAPGGRRVVSAGGGKRRKAEETTETAPAAATTETQESDTEEAPKPLLGEADPELERLLQEEEDINRRIRQQHETPHFRGGED